MPDESNVEVFSHKERGLETPKIKMGAASLASTKHPENEDALYMSSDSRSPLKVFAVFDGMGGHEGGAEASSSALHAVKDRIENGNVDPNLSLQQTEGLIKSVLLEAHEKVKAQSLGERGMGTTASIGMIWEGKGGERKLVVGNVGDSGIYIFRDGKLTKLTVDDDLGHMGRGNILTQALGREDIEPRMGVFDVLPGDQIITISDGISDAMKDDLDEEFQKALVAHKGNPAQAANALVAKAREYTNAGGKMDDQTALVVDIENEDSSRMHAFSNPQSSDPEKKAPGPRRIPIGAEVRVMRSSGKMERGWFVVGYDENGKAKLRNENMGLSKGATLSQLEELNPPPDKTTSLSDFRLSLQQIPEGGIQSEIKFYPTEELLEIFDGVVDNNEPITRIPRPIRSKVEELIRIDKITRQIH